MQPWFSHHFANPSATYREAQKARAAIDDARVKLANFLGCSADEVIFTSSGTESCNYGIIGFIEPFLLRGGRPHIITSTIEHSAVLESIRYLERSYNLPVTYLSVNEEGIIELEAVLSALREDTRLVSIMTVNNEIGTLQPIAELGKICRDKGISLHTDACQASGYRRLKVDELQVDLLSLNAAKIYGPKGVGALYIREHIEMTAWTEGGGQEFKRLSGTENVPAIIGFGKALERVEEAQIQESKRLRKLRDQLWKTLQSGISGLELNGSLEHRSPNNLNLWIKDTDAGSLVRRMDLDGFAIAMGSACASGTTEPSHVISSIKGEKAAKESIRVSLGKSTTKEELTAFAASLQKAVGKLRR